jgi:hypothetical protein
VGFIGHFIDSDVIDGFKPKIIVSSSIEITYPKVGEVAIEITYPKVGEVAIEITYPKVGEVATSPTLIRCECADFQLFTF